MKQFYVRLGSQSEGPFTLDDLKSKSISRQTPVWSDGMADWQIATNVPELLSLFPSGPPPFEPIYTPPPIHVDDSPRKSSVWKKIFIGAGIMLLAYLAIAWISSLSQPSPESYQEKVMSVTEMEAASPVSYLSVDGNYSKNFFGTKFVIEGSVKNNATVATYKDVVLVVNFYSNTNSVIKTEYHTLYKYFPPHSTQSFKFKMKTVGDASRLGIEISDAKNN